MLAPDRNRLLDLLKQKSLMFGDFTLASGQKSTFYFDSKKTTLTAEGSWLTAAQVLSLIRERGLEAQAIGGMTLGADPIVCPVAALSHRDGPPLDSFIVRKEAKGHGTSRQIEGNLPENCRVIVVDDVVTTGGSTLRAIEAVEEAGHTVVAVICLVDREQGGEENLKKWPFYPIFRKAEVFDDAAARN